MTNEEYVKMQKMWLKATGVKEGSWVKVTRKAENYESGWGTVWANEMDSLVDKTVCALEFDNRESNRGVFICTKDDYKYWVPFFVLEPAEAPKPEKYRFQPFEQVLVRDEDDEAWRISLFERHARDSFCFACIHGFFWKQCIPYAGHEHLLDTTDEPEDWAKYYDKE